MTNSYTFNNHNQLSTSNNYDKVFMTHSYTFNNHSEVLIVFNNDFLLESLTRMFYIGIVHINYYTSMNLFLLGFISKDVLYWYNTHQSLYLNEVFTWIHPKGYDKVVMTRSYTFSKIITNYLLPITMIKYL
jgi:hypothetical protein